MLNEKITYRKDYQVPAYLIDAIQLRFDLRDEYTIVTSHLQVHRNPESRDDSKTLILNGKELILERVQLDGHILSSSQYQLTDELLLIQNIPDKCELEIKTKIYPEKN